MKTFFTLSLLLLIQFSIKAQQARYSYLVVTLSTHTDYESAVTREYFQIDAEPHNKEADPIYSLKYYRRGNDTRRALAAFYFEKKDSAVTYNYFLNTTEALNYMSSLGWELLSVNTVIASDVDFAENPYIDNRKASQAYTKMGSKIVYYMRKTILPVSPPQN